MQDGYTALMLAIENDHNEVAFDLMVAGADVNTADSVSGSGLQEGGWYQ